MSENHNFCGCKDNVRLVSNRGIRMAKTPSPFYCVRNQRYQTIYEFQLQLSKHTGYLTGRDGQNLSGHSQRESKVLTIVSDRTEEVSEGFRPINVYKRCFETHIQASEFQYAPSPLHVYVWHGRTHRGSGTPAQGLLLPWWQTLQTGSDRAHQLALIKPALWGVYDYTNEHNVCQNNYYC